MNNNEELSQRSDRSNSDSEKLSPRQLDQTNGLRQLYNTALKTGMNAVRSLGRTSNLANSMAGMSVNAGQRGFSSAAASEEHSEVEVEEEADKDIDFPKRAEMMAE